MSVSFSPFSAVVPRRGEIEIGPTVFSVGNNIPVHPRHRREASPAGPFARRSQATTLRSQVVGLLIKLRSRRTTAASHFAIREHPGRQLGLPNTNEFTSRPTATNRAER